MWGRERDRKMKRIKWQSKQNINEKRNAIFRFDGITAHASTYIMQQISFSFISPSSALSGFRKTNELSEQNSEHPLHTPKYTNTNTRTAGQLRDKMSKHEDLIKWIPSQQKNSCTGISRSSYLLKQPYTRRAHCKIRKLYKCTYLYIMNQKLDSEQVF